MRFSKLYFAAALLLVSGCLGSGVETTATKEIKEIPPVFPTVTFDTPSASTVSSASAATTIDMAIFDAVNVSLDSSRFALVTTGSASCTIGVTGVTNDGATVRLTSCSGNGTVAVYLKAFSLLSNTFTANLESDPSDIITVDNSGPLITSMIPASAPVGSVPPTVQVDFNEPVNPADVTIGLFNVAASTCSVVPLVGAPAMSNGNRRATVTLTGASCVDGETVVVSVNAALVRDVLGNFGLGTTSRTYVFTDGPLIVFDPPSATEVSSSSPTLTIEATFTNAANTPVLNNTTVGITGTPSCTISSPNETNTGATIQLTNCTGNGALAIHINAGVLLTPGDSIPNLQSADSATITVDNTGPTISAFTPADATVNSVGAIGNLVVDFNDAMLAASLANTDFSLAGSTCAVNPTVGAPSLSIGDTRVTATLAGGTCNHGQELRVTVTPSSFEDSVGNDGTGVAIQRIYTFDTQGPTIGFGAPSPALINAAGTASIVATFTDNVTIPVISNGNIDLITTGDAACTTVTSPDETASNATIQVSGCSGDGTVAVRMDASVLQDTIGNFNLQSGNSPTFTVDTTGPSIVDITGVVASLGTSGTITFDEAVAFDSSDVDVITDCTVPPTIANVTPGAGTSTTFNFDIVGGTCDPGQFLTIQVNAATDIVDPVGNAGQNTDFETHNF